MANNRESLELWVEVTSRCNYSCYFCYNHFHTISKKNDGVEITSKDLNFLLTSIQKNYSISIICFSGGEPLLRKDIDELIKTSSHFCKNIIIATNGYDIYSTNIKQIVTSGCNYFQIPLLGSTPESHDEISGLIGSYERLMQGLFILKTHGIETTIIFIWNHKNSKELKGILDISYLLGIKSIIINEIRLKPDIITHFGKNEILEKKKDFILALKSVKKYAKMLNINIYVPTYIPKTIIQNLKFQNIDFIYSKSEVKRLVIDSKGCIKRCVASTNSFGSIYSQNIISELKNALNSTEYLCPCKIEENMINKIN